MRKRGFALSLGLPEDATSDCARVTLSGQSAALVEGQHGVIELTESRVRLRTARGADRAGRRASAAGALR